MVLWLFRRRPPLWVRIAQMTLLVGSAAGAAVGAEMLRRRLGLGKARLQVDRNGRTARVRVSLPRSKAGRRKRRSVVSGS